MLKHKQKIRQLAPYLQKWRTSWMLRYMTIGEDKESINTALAWGYRHGWLERKDAKEIAFKSRDRRDSCRYAYRLKN